VAKKKAKAEQPKLDGKLTANCAGLTAKIKALPMLNVIRAPLGVNAQPLAAIQWLKYELLTSNNYNPNNVAPIELELLKLSILCDGWTQPIVGFQTGKHSLTKPWIEIVDGFHRWSLCADPQIWALTEGLVPVVVLEGKTQAERMAATIRHNRARGRHGVAHVANMVRSLHEDQGMSKQAIMDFLGMEKEEVERFLIHTGLPTKVGKETQDFHSAWTTVSHEEAKAKGMKKGVK